MPCYEPRSDDIARAENFHRSELQVKETANTINRLTALLCEACGIIDKAGFGSPLSPDLAAWWKQHQKDDRRRKAAEQSAIRKSQLKLRAMAKLTSEERDALGL